MTNRLLVLSVDDIHMNEIEKFKRFGIQVRIIDEINEIRDSIYTFKPSAILIYGIFISKGIIDKVQEVLVRQNMFLPWLCYVYNNSSSIENYARINKVFYYGVGQCDREDIIQASMDAIMVGKIQNSFEMRFGKS